MPYNLWYILSTSVINKLFVEPLVLLKPIKLRSDVFTHRGNAQHEIPHIKRPWQSCTTDDTYTVQTAHSV